MNMPNVLICSSGSVSSALLRLGTRWGLKCSILVTVLSTRMESIIQSGFAATDAKRDSIWIVSPLRNLKHSNGHSCVPSIPVGSSLDLKRVTSTKRVVKRVKQVIIPISVAKEKVGKKRIKQSLVSVGPREKCKLTTPPILGQGIHLCQWKSKFHLRPLRKSTQMGIAWCLLVLEKKYELTTPHNFGSRNPSVSTEIKISPSAIKKKHQNGSSLVSVCPREKV